MDEPTALQLLLRELAVWRAKSYSDLVAVLDQPQCMETTGPDGKRYQIEINVFWDSKKGQNVRVLGSIDDGGWRAFKPLSEDFIVTPAGAFVGE